MFGYLSRDEMLAVIGTPGGTWLGQRDHVLFLLLYNTGARVSEITGVKVSDVVLDDGASCVHLHGKGRKQRSVPLWRTTVKVALDCIPALRRAILDTLSERPGLSTSEAAESIAYPTTTTRRTLEDLHAYGLVDRELRGAGNADRWTLSRLAYDLRASVPEMSVGVLSESTEGTSI